MDIKIRNKLIENMHCVSYGLVILITKYWWYEVLEISRYA